MAKAEQVEIIIPSSPADRKALFAGIKEIDNSMTRVQGEKDFQREAIEKLAEKFDIDKKYVRRMANDYHKDTFDKKVSEQEQYQGLYEAVMHAAAAGAVSDDIEEDEEDEDEE